MLGVYFGREKYVFTVKGRFQLLLFELLKYSKIDWSCLSQYSKSVSHQRAEMDITPTWRHKAKSSLKSSKTQIIQTDTIHDKYAGAQWAQQSWHGLYFQGEFEANVHHITWISYTSLGILSGSLITAKGGAAKS